MRRWRWDPVSLGALTWIGIVMLVAVAGPLLAPFKPFTMVQVGGKVGELLPPTPGHWLGTTSLGYDVLSQLILGARTAVVVGLSAAAVTVALGILVGLVSGYYRGTTDTLLMRLADLAYAIPFEPLAIVLLAVIATTESMIVAAIVCLFWRQSARVIRNQVLTASQRPFVKSAKLSGAGNAYIILRHLLPQAASLALVYMPVAFGNAILAEASVDFLGFGNPAIISWGGMLRTAFTDGAIGHAIWWSLSPGLAITLTTAAVYLASWPLEEVLDPRLRRQAA